MYRIVLCAAAVLLALGAGLSPAAADDAATCYSASGDEAIAACSRQIDRNPKDAVAHHNRGVEYQTKGDYDRAFADYDEAVRINPQYAQAYDGRGRVWQHRGDYDRALADYGQAIRINPNYASAYAGRCSAYVARKEFDSAIADCGEVIRRDPKSATAFTSRGNAWYAKGDFDRAIADFDRAIGLDPKSAAAYNDRGKTWRDKGDYDRALADHDQAIQLDPKNAFAYSQRCADNVRKKAYDRVIADCSEAIRLNPKDDAAWNNRGIAYENKSDYDRAIADYSRSLELDPNYAKAYNGRGNSWYGKRDFDRAIADYDQAIRLDATYGRPHSGRGGAYENKKDYDRAIADYDEALRLDPGDAFARDGRARVQPLASRRPADKPAVAVAAERRVALVIGNSHYRAVDLLPNPKRDADAVAAALRDAGFQTVTVKNDLGRDALRDTLRTFRAEADAADWALIYYAGHGLQISGNNYLVPVDAMLRDERDVKGETIAYDELEETVRGAGALRIIILDACRTDPFTAQMARRNPDHDVKRGLRPPPEGRPGLLVVYSARDGQVAEDGDGEHSPFAAALIGHLRTPGREVRRMFDDVSDDVLEATKNRQQPFTYGRLPGKKDFFFVAGK